MAVPSRAPFDPQTLLRKPTRPDPWARAETWRYTGPFTRYNRFKGALPGFGIASVAFAGYCVFEYFFLNEEHGHGEKKKGHGAGEGH